MGCRKTESNHRTMRGLCWRHLRLLFHVASSTQSPGLGSEFNTTVGCGVGFALRNVGNEVGVGVVGMTVEGVVVGLTVGSSVVGSGVGNGVGAKVGPGVVGAAVEGVVVGAMVGPDVVGTGVEDAVGAWVGSGVVGVAVGAFVGMKLGRGVGSRVESLVGSVVGPDVVGADTVNVVLSEKANASPWPTTSSLRYSLYPPLP